MSDVFVAPAAAKEKKKRAPMSEERKAVLREQLAKAREVKKAARLAAKAEKEALKAKPVEPVPIAEPVKLVVEPVPEVKVAVAPPPTSDYKSEIELLKQELAAIKADKVAKQDKSELDALKQELKDIRDAAKAYKTAKAKKDKEDKALAKKLKETPVAQPAPQKQAPSLPIPIPEAPRYSTYRKSIWNKFK